MVEISFKATWLRDVQKFHVQWRGLGETHVELMTPERYAQFCTNLSIEMEICGWKLVFTGGPLSHEVENQIRKYFRDVLTSYRMSLEGHGTIFHL
jgi:hypothetical protein